MRKRQEEIMANKLEILIEAQNNAQKELEKISEQLKKITGQTQESGKQGKTAADMVEKSMVKVGLAFFSVRKVANAFKNELVDIIRIAQTTNADVEQSFLRMNNEIYKAKKQIADDLAPSLIVAADAAAALVSNLDFSKLDTSGLVGILSGIMKLPDILSMGLGGLTGAFSGVKGPEKEENAVDEAFIAETIQKERLKYVQLTSIHEEWVSENSTIDELYIENYVLSEQIKYEQLMEMHQAFLDEKTGMEETYVENYIAQETLKVDQMRAINNAWLDEDTAAQMAKNQRDSEYLQFALETQRQAHQSFWPAVGKLRDTFAAGTSKILVDMIRGTLDVRTAFEELGWSMVQIIVDYLIQMGIALAMSQVFRAADLAASTAHAAAVAAVWAVPAALVSLATFGANAVAAAAGISTVTALTVGLAATVGQEGGVGTAISTSSGTGVRKGISGAAEGGTVMSSGTVLIGERGPELLNLPAGARITPLDKAQRGNSVVSINVEINNPVMTSKEQLNEIKDALVEIVSEGLNDQMARL
jgi:hypothetical protein